MDYEQLGNRIKNRRLELKLSQDKASELAGISLSFYGQIERAERKLSLETLIAIANALNVTVDFLLSDSLLLENDIYIDQIIKLIGNKTDTTKKIAVDIIHALAIHTD